MRPLALCLVLLAALCAPAAAQTLSAHVPRGPSLRPLDERLAAADAVAIGTVREVELGRIQVGDAVTILGVSGESFALKRAPSRPPPLEAGDRAVLLLRGARSPWVLVDEPQELTVLPDAASETRWHEALRAALSARNDPPALRDLYLSWLSGPDAGLRELARVGLTATDPPFGDLPEDAVAELVRDAMDPGLDPDRRRAAAHVALRSRAGAPALIARLPGGETRTDPVIVLDALQMAALRGDPALGPLLARALSHPQEEVRRSALGLGRLAARIPEARPALERMAQEDPVEELRAAAQRTLTRRR